jgi:hypothetical protein
VIAPLPEDIRDFTREIFKKVQVKANSYARKNGYGKATKITFHKTRKSPRIVEARSGGYTNFKGDPVRFFGKPTRRQLNSVTYVPAQCWVQLPRV